jgi:hypothetical protein
MNYVLFLLFSAVIFMLQLVISVTFGEGRSTKNTARQEKCVRRNTSGVVSPFFSCILYSSIVSRIKLKIQVF